MGINQLKRAQLGEALAWAIQESGVLQFIKKKLNFWLINFFLMVAVSFFLNGGVFTQYTKGISLSKGGMGILKLSGQNRTTDVGIGNNVAGGMEFYSLDTSLPLK